jgi:hypothetical protein
MGKFVLYKRTGGRNGTIYLIKSQLQFGEVTSNDNASIYTYEREVLAESDDLHLLHRMKELAEGGEDD